MKKNNLKFRNAIRYKITYIIIGDNVVKEKEFSSTKSLEQFVSRNEDVFDFILLHRFALVNSKWIRYAIIGNKTLLINELEAIINQLKDDSVYDSDKYISPKMKNKKRQKTKNEESEHSKKMEVTK